MKIKPVVSIKSKITNVKVIVSLDFMYQSQDQSGIEKRQSLTKKEFDFPRNFKLSIPLHINYDGYLYDHLNTINVILVRALNEIVGDAKQKAEQQMISMFDIMEVTIKDIHADKDLQHEEPDLMAEWRYQP